ncbi:unnamed protein product [Haemonchus placei]|uniref:Acyl_transf_3 domain-containing protein n=1 Tax=Haemonchus placei TaxID=6290 RepID=A0A0N4X2F2_HAEPC|nr:unnamed protein product [Haemonchus placei]
MEQHQVPFAVFKHGILRLCSVIFLLAFHGVEVSHHSDVTTLPTHELLELFVKVVMLLFMAVSCRRASLYDGVLLISRKVRG